SAIEHAASDPLSLDHLVSLRERLHAIRQAALAVERTAEDEIALVDINRRTATRNLVDYLALRQQDIRDLQRELYQVGRTSLGAVQGNVMATITAVIRVLDRLCEAESTIADSPLHPSHQSHRRDLEDFTNDTLGPPAETGLIRVMVTMPSEAAHDP